IGGTIGLGILLGRAMKMDADTALITSTGAAICGAAAVLGAEPVIKCESHKTAIAVSTVVIFGTLSMFLYPIMYRAGLLSALDNAQVAIYTGSTLHEVAHVAGAGNAMDPTDALGIAGAATITKMIRVIMLAPVLIIMALCLRSKNTGKTDKKTKITIPWFAINFILVIVLNTLLQQYDGGSMAPWIYAKGSWVELFDSFCLTMAMTALGADTSIDKFRQAGAKPFYLAGGIYIWLVAGGYLLARYLVPVLQ
ncbi:MAG: putative sulfate exporter family transporter, partial [Bacteroidales bacterium]|nr:putative sulfate exporter family transporter [Candidatus Sodaliphilus fimicaballi]